MKINCSKIVSVLAATILLSSLTGCVSLPDFSEKQIEKFQNAQGTPKDSVVFYGFLPMNDEVKFKQIDKKYPSDEQDGIKLSLTDSSGFWLSTPVVPGSTYMISYMKGSVQGGMSTSTSTNMITPNLTQQTTTTTFETNVWDQEFTEDMQYFVIKIPKEPGLYCFGQYMGREIMANAQAGNPTQLFDQSNIKEKWGKNGNQVIVNGLTQLIKAYKGTEWETLALEEMGKYPECKRL